MHWRPSRLPAIKQHLAIVKTLDLSEESDVVLYQQGVLILSEIEFYISKDPVDLESDKTLSHWWEQFIYQRHWVNDEYNLLIRVKGLFVL